MIKINGYFKYRKFHDTQRNEATGFYNVSSKVSEWINGCECQIDKTIPAKQIMGTDGQMHAYNFDMFIPTWFNNKLEIAFEIEVTFENGSKDTFIIQGIDENRKYIEIWG